jgi:uncharacterized membrane protein YcaP (DUF421 family)
MIRTVILYLVLIIGIRMMGKHQVGELEPSELVLSLTIADLASVPMQDYGIPLVTGLIPILTLLCLTMIFSVLSLKSTFFRNLLCGRPSVIIRDGRIDQREMARSRLTVDELLEELRTKGYPDLSAVNYAILETSGQLSVLPYAAQRPPTARMLGMEPKEQELPLLLISDGPRFQQVKEQVAQLGIQDAVIFAGRRSDVAGIYSAMDLFMLPSCWEGLPLVLVEAQVNGLPMLVSDVVTRVAKCTDRVTYKALDDGAEDWARSMQELLKVPVDRLEDTVPAIAAKGFDIHVEAEKLRQLYVKDFK